MKLSCDKGRILRSAHEFAFTVTNGISPTPWGKDCSPLSPLGSEEERTYDFSVGELDFTLVYSVSLQRAPDFVFFVSEDKIDESEKRTAVLESRLITFAALEDCAYKENITAGIEIVFNPYDEKKKKFGDILFEIITKPPNLLPFLSYHTSVNFHLFLYAFSF